jgi:CheY-like chemotaxis protein
MSVEVVPGGQRRIDRVLDPRFTDGVEQLDLAELRARREEAEAEEADVSYLRRLLQGRLDILRAELERRSAGGDQDVAALLAGLPAILSDDAPGTFSAVPRVQVPSRAGEHRRRVERLVSDETIARLPELDVEEVTRAVEVLGGRGGEGLDPPAGRPAGGRRAPRGAGPPGPMHTSMELNRVLIVDDDPAIRRVVSALLDLDEYGLLEAADGQAALEVVRDERPDLVILDLTMPRLDGLGTCQALRSDPELAGTRVLVLTGRDQPDDRAAARDAGADAYLVKPFSSLALLDAVKRLTDG